MVLTTFYNDGVWTCCIHIIWRTRSEIKITWMIAISLIKHSFFWRLQNCAKEWKEDASKKRAKRQKKSQKGTKTAKMDSRYNDLVIGLLIPGAILVTLCIVLGLFKVCYRSSHPSDPKTQLAYPVAISNRLFNVCKCLFHCINRWLKTKCEILNFNALIFVVIEIQKEKRSKLKVSSFRPKNQWNQKKSLIE